MTDDILPEEDDKDKELELSQTRVEILQNQMPACATAPKSPTYQLPRCLKLNPRRGDDNVFLRTMQHGEQSGRNW